ncbi:MAG TPA: hypothetical protein VN685_05690 [Rhizomicrobium sp.]|nr:hypothetical protein [Rhizomicrobium sp.]
MVKILSDILKPWNIIRRVKETHEIVAELPSHVKWIENYTSSVAGQIESARMDLLFLNGQVAARDMPLNLDTIQAAEFRVFSQWSEDGIIQFLIKRLAGRIDPSFVEFGVQHYLESNTLFLLMNNGWRGLVLDGEESYIRGIRNRGFDWKYGLQTLCAFVSRENINAIFQKGGVGSELGLLSIDVDGIDWHLWEALTLVKPGIVVIEYNRNFPLDRPITIPYEPLFDRTSAHESRWYFGASLAALAVLAKEKGYTFVGVESHRRNAFFVRNDLASLVPNDVPKEAHLDRDTATVVKALSGLPVYNVLTKAIEKI